MNLYIQHIQSQIEHFLMSITGFISPYYAPLNDRIRKRKAFADQELMQSTLNCYLNYQHMHQLQSSTTTTLLLPSFQPEININSNNLLNAKEMNNEQTQTRTISFSIDSILGIKWVSCCRLSVTCNVHNLYLSP